MRSTRGAAPPFIHSFKMRQPETVDPLEQSDCALEEGFFKVGLCHGKFIIVGVKSVEPNVAILGT